MKLLCWMHRKFRQNTNEALKALVIGQTSLDQHDQQQYFQKPTNFTSSKPFKPTQRTRKSFADHEDYMEAVIDSSSPELFHGFLAIGTLGSSDQIATPTFAISVENIAENNDQSEVTENELKLINDELEKVLSAETPSSGRNSHVSNGRSSHVSGGEEAVCPLQGYLFGSAIELSETAPNNAAAPAAAKKGERMSLGELFQRNKIGESERERFDEKREIERSSLIKKKGKKKKIIRADSAPTENKLNKILHMFHRKVHPETSIAEMKSAKPQKKKTSHDGSGNNDEGQIAPDEDLTLCPQRALFLKQKIRRYRSQSNPPQFTFTTIDSNGNREQWIKTDADYLVLEL